MANHIAHGSYGSADIRQLSSDQVQMVKAFIQQRVMNPEDVDDILQSTFLEALRSEHRFQGNSTIQTWLCGIALNLVRNHFRRLYSQPFKETWEEHLHGDQKPGHEIGYIVDSHRQLAKTVQEISLLPAKMQKVIQVSLEMDGNYQDTAISLGVPVGTVRSRLSRARDQLRQRLEVDL